MRPTRRSFQASCRASRPRWAPKDSGARVELEAALTRVREGARKTQASSVQQSRCGQRGSKVEGHQVGEGFGSNGGILQEPRSIVCRGHSQRPKRQHGNAPWRFKSKNAENLQAGPSIASRSWRQTSWPRRTCWRKGEHD